MDGEISLPAPEDPAASAFEALRREVALLRAAMLGLTAERPAIPDYSETLGEISKAVAIGAARMQQLASSPALELTPADVVRQIASGGADARQQDRASIHRAQETLQRVAGDLQTVLESARLAGAQNWRLMQAGAAGLVGGAVIWAFLPSLVADGAPESWRWPEMRAAGALHSDMWSAGQRLMQVAAPDQWREVKTANALFARNRETLSKCVKEAERTRMVTCCSLSVGPDALR